MSEPKVEQWRLPDENMKPLIKQWRELYPYVEHATMDDFIILARTIARETIDAYAARQPDSGEPKENYMLDIGTARRALFVEGTHNWNGWVRDITAEVEVTGEFVDAKKVLQGLGKKLRDVAMRNQLASDLQGAFMSEPPETPAEEATCPMCAKPVFETVETPAGDEQAREVATKLVYSVSKWAGRSPEFMQMMVAKWEDRISAHVAHVTSQLRQQLHTYAEERKQAKKELAEAKFSPAGDNHHNAAKCPYCNPAYLNNRTAETTVSQLRQELEKLRADTVTEVCDWIAQEVGTGVGRLVREHFAAPSPSLADKEINEEIANQSDQ